MRLIIFLSVLSGLILVFILHSYKNLPVVNEPFDLAKTEKTYNEKVKLAADASLAKEAEATPGEEVEVVEYAPVVELSTPQLMAGNKVFGQCIACHGKGGEGKLAQKAPHIGGQYDWYIEKQLSDMKSGARINPTMEPILKGLSPQNIKDVAAYITLLPWNKEKYLAAQKAAKK